MHKPFFRGLVIGLLGPCAFVGGILYWVHRATRKVPFPVSMPGHGELVIGLVEPSEVRTYWEPWRQSLLEVRDKFVAAAKELKTDLGQEQE